MYKIYVLDKKNKEIVFEYLDFENFKESLIMAHNDSEINYSYSLDYEDLTYINYIEVLQLNSEINLIEFFKQENVFTVEDIDEWIEAAKLLNDSLNESIKQS